jgi:hypothetical protein
VRAYVFRCSPDNRHSTASTVRAAADHIDRRSPGRPCVTRVVTGRVEPSTAVTSAPDDVVSNRSAIASGKMRCDCPVCSTTRSRLPRGRQLVTLEDAARYIQKLPKAEQQIDDWQTAVEVLILVAESNGGPCCAHRRHAGAQSKGRTSLQCRLQRPPLGPAQAEARSVTAGSMSPMPWRQRRLLTQRQRIGCGPIKITKSTSGGTKLGGISMGFRWMFAISNASSIRWALKGSCFGSRTSIINPSSSGPRGS